MTHTIKFHQLAQIEEQETNQLEQLRHWVRKVEREYLVHLPEYLVEAQKKTKIRDDAMINQG